mmetsp:Transcript_50011/g.106418  ORF Transcript_50011/g.106418 Transcript_50011/m.106418 type:complete len:89 (+) Transcript_50011:181-447(+)
MSKLLTCFLRWIFVEQYSKQKKGCEDFPTTPQTATLPSSMVKLAYQIKLFSMPLFGSLCCPRLPCLLLSRDNYELQTLLHNYQGHHCL